MARKKQGEILTDDEARLQIAFGGTMIAAGFIGGIGVSAATSNPAPFYIGTYVMLDGSVLISDGLNNKKRSPFAFGAETLFIPPYIPSEFLLWR